MQSEIFGPLGKQGDVDVLGERHLALVERGSKEIKLSRNGCKTTWWVLVHRCTHISRQQRQAYDTPHWCGKILMRPPKHWSWCDLLEPHTHFLRDRL
jgi:hypothetical protein